LTRVRGPVYVHAMGRKKAISKRLQPAPVRSALASKIAGKWAGGRDSVALDRMVSELGDVPRYDIVAALKELEKTGAGEFVVGHAGRKSHFVWRAAPAARRRRGKQESAAAGSALTGVLEHVFHLRPGFAATVRLPQDVTQMEIERFCHFLKAIPFVQAGDAAEA
jgi:hypothetical protein